MRPTVSGPTTLVIACGALGREVASLVRACGFDRMAVTCLPAQLHNRPQDIPEAVRARIRSERGRYDRFFVLYGDCGTGGRLDAVLAEEGAERIPGAHCYEFYAGSADFAALVEDQPGTFFLTDYLVRQFERLVWRGLGLDRHPELLPDYFGNYTRLVHLAQTDDPELDAAARAAAGRLRLTHERRFTGLSELARFLPGGSATDGFDGLLEHRLLA